jgi:hypothetical protein
LEADKHTCDQDECSELSQTKIECRLANSISLLLNRVVAVNALLAGRRRIGVQFPTRTRDFPPQGSDML